MKHKLSIITSVFKAERFMRHFLSDVARQTMFSDCELILLNANSPENEEKIIEEFASVYPENTKYIKLDKTYNIYETWNKGVDAAKADILTNWNVDDRRFFNSLYLQYSEFEKDKDVDVVYGPTLTTYVENENPENCLSKEGFGCFEATMESMLVNNSPHCLPMWRKSVHDRFGYFDAKYPIAGDYEMWLRALKCGAKFKMISSLIGTYYRNPIGASSNPLTINKAMEEIAEIREQYKK